MKVFLKFILMISVIITVNTTAAAAFAQNNLPLRSGPGSRYPVKAVTDIEKPIKFALCNPTWCYIHTGRQEGWVRTKNISAKTTAYAYHYANSGNFRSFNRMAVNGLRNNETLSLRLKIERRPVRR